MLIIVLAISGFAPVQFDSKTSIGTFERFPGRTETAVDVIKVEEGNIFLGPSTRSLIKFGAKFVPCLKNTVEAENEYNAYSEESSRGLDNVSGFSIMYMEPILLASQRHIMN